jgi:hypothetical protein
MSDDFTSQLTGSMCAVEIGDLSKKESIISAPGGVHRRIIKREIRKV